MDESEKMKRLKELLLEDDRDAYNELSGKVDALNEEISNNDKLIDMLYPVIGKIIRKFIRTEIQIITEKIDAQVQNAFSWKGWKRRFKSWFGGAKESELMIRDLANPQLEEMFVIENGSGLIKASYSKNNTVDKDMIAGMLTAIKAFVEDAFSKGNESLEVIEYESYQISIYNVKTFYVAVVSSGILTANFKAKMENQILDFIEKYLANINDSESSEKMQYISEQLKEYFDDSEI